VTIDAPRESDDEWAARVTRAVCSGSREALAEIYDRCAQELVDAIVRITRRDESFALDCLQEMFMRLAAHPPIVETHAALVAWMRVTALNVARNTIVAEARRVRRERSRPSDDSASSATGSDEPVESLLARLDAEEVALLRLRHVEGMRVKAIARALGATPRAIESALRRIVARIRDGGTP
jgi:RNA polymerase sigma factor (sigma-70 family)